MTIVYVLFFFLSIVNCLHGRQLEIEVFFFLDISSSVRCVKASSVGNKNASVVLIVCMEGDFTYS